YFLPSSSTPTTYTLSLHDALPISAAAAIITLAVAVTLHMERQQLDPEFSGLRPEPPEAKKEPLAAAPPQESPAKPSGSFFASGGDRKSTRLNSSHLVISYAVFCLK